MKLRAYYFDDKTPPSRAYYRLRMVDLDGSFSYSNIIFLENTRPPKDQISVYPNPAGDFLHLSWPGVDTYEVFLYDASGKLVLSSINPGHLNLAGLMEGVYWLCLRNSENGIEVGKRIVHLE